MSEARAEGLIEERRTDRMRLRRLLERDRGDLGRMHADPRVMATLGGLHPPDEIEAMTDRLLGDWERHGFGYWSLRDFDTDEFLGRGGLRRVSVAGRDEVEVGYGLCAEHWGRGLATELALECTRAAFLDLRLPDLVCFTLTTNRRSQRVMEKAGFDFEDEIVHAELPHFLYRLTASRWRESK